MLLTPAAVAEPLPGPVPAEIVRVIDGDTIAVRANIWPGHYVETRVRLGGADTPETFRPGCEAERARGEDAKAFTDAWLTGEAGYVRISLTEIDLGSFAGRVIARIGRADGADLSDALIAADLASPYGQERDWCAVAPSPPSR
ncbi:MAG: nuclease [Oceanicaulis sp.]